MLAEGGSGSAATRSSSSPSVWPRVGFGRETLGRHSHPTHDAAAPSSSDGTTAFPDFGSFAGHVAFFLEDGMAITYAQLELRVKEFQRRFVAGRGLMLLEADNSIGTMVAYLAALRSHCPVALVEPGAGAKTAAIRSRFVFRYHYAGPSDTFSVDPEPDDAELHPSLALLLSTSGSTGSAKYVCLSRENLIENARSIAAYLNLSPADRAPTNLPFFYSYGLSVVNSHLMAGASIVLTKMSVMDAPFWDLFDRLRCTSFAGVPHTYEMLAQSGFATADRKSLRYCTQAGGRLSRALVLDNAARAKEQGWKFYVMYGQTEASPRMAYLPPDSTLEHPECIGVPVPGGSLRLEDDNGAVIDQPDTPGELVYAGPNVMLGYAFRRSDLASPSGGRELRTGDMACRNRAGLYYIVGRKSRFLKMFGLRVSLDSVEDFLATRGLKAACGGADGSLRILAVGGGDTARIAASVASWLGIPPFSVEAFGVEDLPLQSNGKIDYQRVQAILEMEHRRREQSADAEPPARPDASAHARLTSNERKLAVLFAKATGQQLTDPSVTLRSAGADSLSIVQIRMELDKYMTEVPENWIDLPASELARGFAAEEVPPVRRLLALKSIDSFILFRAMAILFVVAHHFHWFVVPGGSTTLLFVIGGYLFYETVGASALAGGSVTNLWTGLAVVVSTLLAATLLQAAGHQYFGSSWHITLLLPYENLSSYITDRLGEVDTKHHVHWLWFIHAYIQVFALLALALSSSRIRNAFVERTYLKVLGCFAATQAIAAALIVADSTRLNLGHSAALLQYAPTTVLPIVLFGILIALTRTRAQYIGTAVAGLSYVALHFAGVFTQGGIVTLLSVTLLLFVRTIRVPGFMLHPLLKVSEASLFIYLVHMPLQFGVARVLKWEVPPSILTVATVAVSIGLWQIWRSLVVQRIRSVTL